MKLLLETLHEKGKTQEISEISITILEPEEELEGELEAPDEVKMKINLQIAPKFKEVFLSKAKNIVLYSPQGLQENLLWPMTWLLHI